jgi:hypothetical protein
MWASQTGRFKTSFDLLMTDEEEKWSKMVCLRQAAHFSIASLLFPKF